MRSNRKDKIMESLNRVLEKLVETPGINVAVCVGRNGIVIDAASTGSSDIEALGVMTTTCMGSAEGVGRVLGLEEINQAMMKYKGGIVIMTPLGSYAHIVVVAPRDADLRGARLQVKRSVPKLLAAM